MDSTSADLLSQAWQRSALHLLQPPRLDRNNTVVDKLANPSSWNPDDVKTWVRMQQAIHPEVDYQRCIRNKWTSISIKRWMEESKRRGKERDRLRRAEVHAAMSVAGVAAALAAVAAENAKVDRSEASRDGAVASAAALVAAQCARAAEEAGAEPEQLRVALEAAVASTNAEAILTLSAAAASALRARATLKGRSKNAQGSNGNIPLALMAEENDFNFAKSRTILAKGTSLLVQTCDGSWSTKLVQVLLDREAKVTLKIKKPHAFVTFRTAKEIIAVVQGCCGEEDGEHNYHSLVLATSVGDIKMKYKDTSCYKLWRTTIEKMLMMLSAATERSH